MPGVEPLCAHLLPVLAADPAGGGFVLAADPAGGGSMLGMLMPILIVGFIFYFLVFRPASKERKQREADVKSLKKHDKVVTNAGIHGVVMSMEDDSVVLRIDDKNNVRVKFSRAAIWQVLDGDAAIAKS